MEEFAGREGGEVFGDVDAALVEFEQFALLRLFAGAEDDAEGGFFAGLLLVLGEPTEIQFHLALILCLEVAELEVDGDEAFQATMVEEEIEVEVVGIDLDAELAGLEGEALAEFEEEGFEFAEDGVFKVFFQIAVLETEEVEDLGITEDEVRCELVFTAEGGKLGPGNFLGLL